LSPPEGPARRWRLDERRLYLCTPDRPDLEGFIDACIDGGVDIVQLRDKQLSDRHVVERAGLVQRVCADHRVPFILNDRPDLAAAIGADGVHVGQEDLSPAEARRLMGDDAIIGLSTHGVGDLERALGGPLRSGEEDGPDSPGSVAPVSGRVPVDYISAGPVVPTPTKPGRAGTGLGYVGVAVRRAPWPVWVTGGVDPTTVAAMVAAGADHFVVVRWLTGAADPRARAAELRGAVDDALSRSPGNQPDAPH
jgi:thiamine-phosphate pyrophosphorylase